MSAMPDDISAPDELGEAYKELRWVLATLQSDLGGGHFARSVTLRAVREAFSAVRARDSLDFIPFTECFFCSAPEMHGVISAVQSAFRLRDDPATHEGEVITQSGKREAGGGRPASPGRLALRGLRLYFETHQAGVLLAHAYNIYEHHPSMPGKWVIAANEELTTFAASFSGRAPKVSVSYTKSENAAIKGLLRLAEDTLAVAMREVQA